MSGFDDGAAQRVTLEEKALSEMSRYLRWEKRAWKIAGIVFIIYSVLFALAGLFVFTVGILYTDQSNTGYVPMPSVFAMMTVGITYIALALFSFLPVGIINLIMINKVSCYQEAVYTDLPAARRRCTSVGMIVFGFFFNKIALIFIIINFIKTKNNAAILDRVEAGQKL